MTSVDEHFAVFDAYKALLDAAFTHSHGLDFGTSEFHAGFVFFIYEIVMISFFVVCY